MEIHVPNSKSKQLISFNLPMMVTLESFQKMVDAKVVSADGSTIETTLINCNQVSRNRTYYALEDVIRSLDEDVRIQESIQNRLWFGEAEHPEPKEGEKGVSMRRMMKIDDDNVATRIDRYWVDGNDIKGIIQWAGPKGDNYRDLLMNHGSNLAQSIRAFTPNYIEKKDAGGSYVQKTYRMHVATFDTVKIPGLRDSRIMNPKTYAQLIANDKISVTSRESLVEVKYNNVKDEIRDMMLSTEGADFVSDMYGISWENADIILNPDSTITVGLDNSRESLIIPLDGSVISSLF